ncbi:inner membrane protein PLUS sensory box protein LssE [Legionella beliardensis]|uniref:Inner membrane protein PLUS sensory box protein LssE n=1 Tax=Legionella beliardensis TaxID=91822 RepID=A0A378I3A1_9GAMM|nr:EAL domain-containing protein [Legionella beliardensis]STX29667.1 inner membrane protein PLUS sensory box protein LssE [Legionella beliardensis]
MKKKHLLIIEASPDASQLTQQVISAIEKFVFEVITLGEFNTVIARLDEFDLILVDLELTDHEILSAFKQLTIIASHIPIIVISDLENEKTAMNVLKEGVQDYVFKSEITSSSLSRAIHYAIERKKSKQADTQLAAIVENAFDAIVSITADGTITSWNNAAEQIYQYSAGEIIGKPLSILFSRQQQSEYRKIINRIAAGGKISHYETVLKGKNGQYFDVALTISPIKTRSNKVISAAIIIHDITKTKLNEQQLAIQYRVTLALAEAPNLDYAAHSVLKTICEIFEWQVGELWAVDQQKKALCLVSVWYAKDDYRELEKVSHGKQCKLGDDLPGLIWQMARPHWIVDLRNDLKANQVIPFIEKGLQSFFGLPITYNNEVIGVIIFYSKFLSVPSINLISVFTTIGSHMGIFIKRKRVENELLYLAQHDVLTGLGNRASLENNLNHAILNAKVQQNVMALLYLDLDNFKKVNDTMGHDCGDKLLQEVAVRIRNNVRSLDFISRFGGDEFIVILPNIKNTKNIATVAQNLLDVMVQPFVLNQKKFYISVSIGITIYPDDGADAETLIKNADMAMYYAKLHGRNHYQFYLPAISAFTQQKLILESNLHHALEKQEFILYYQPQVAIKTGKISGLEALIRWNSGNNKIIYPKQFISLAEESSLMIPIGEWVLRTACQQIKSWQEDGLFSDLNIAVNVSVQQLNFRFIERLKAILDLTHINPRHLEIEFTESTLMTLNDKNLSIIKQMKELGMKLSIDDFGTGYSSFSYLKDFMIDIIKIDQSFISQLAVDKNCQAIVKAIIAMAKSLNVKAIAEGVETEEQLSILKKFGCHYYQGYLFSKPISVKQVYTLLRKVNH